MNEEIINKLDEITEIIASDKELNELKRLKDKILNNHELLDKINRLKNMDEYSEDYVKLKKEILSNEDYKRYTELENKLFFDIKDINIKLNELIEKRGCH